jgi:hypothetical protein
MEELAMFGALVVSGGGNSAVVVPSEQLVLAQTQGEPLPEFSAIERQTSDEVFTAPLPKHEHSLAMTALVVTAGALALKATVLDEAHLLRDEEEEEQKERARDEAKPDEKKNATE